MDYTKRHQQFGGTSQYQLSPKYNNNLLQILQLLMAQQALYRFRQYCLMLKAKPFKLWVHILSKMFLGVSFISLGKKYLTEFSAIPVLSHKVCKLCLDLI